MFKPQQHHTHLFNKPTAVNIAYTRTYTYLLYTLRYHYFYFNIIHDCAGVT